MDKVKLALCCVVGAATQYDGLAGVLLWGAALAFVGGWAWVFWEAGHGR